MSLEEKVKKTVSEKLSIEEDKIKLESSLIEDLGADSLDIVELVMAIEEAYNIEVPDTDAEKLKTIQDIINYLKEKGLS